MMFDIKKLFETKRDPNSIHYALLTKDLTIVCISSSDPYSNNRHAIFNSNETAVKFRTLCLENDPNNDNIKQWEVYPIEILIIK